MVFSAIHDYFERTGDPRAKHYFLMDSIWKPVAITAAYLLIVQVFGPRLMKDRKPFDVKKYVMAYNIVQVAVNLYLTVIVLDAFSKRNITSCIDIDYTNSETGYRELKCSYIYFLIKILDGMDTIFFILKKSFRQMSFLHIYHHAIMMMITWLVTKYCGGGQSGWACIFNSIIHTLMYSYYFLTAYDSKYKDSPMKKFITQLQLVQFFLLLYFYSYSLFSSCNYSKLMSLLVISQALIFINLFSKFYYNSYIRTKKDNK
ncbi:elongation of very long chain fatty acids protein AAEL008004-like [Coccinella septempunctata]|uniref:elongation of very long chain fatty acids protein AAEL008004-like n=1 Tax=Coccinella septempunctata TaxID=41139 RepID=UPI001D07F614|nr:elongation of very long chain fatty acids protein AAEL008004-like [Coccinella septempunctata]